ncbi:unnamed protein product [Staurois parvus]|uniref:Uncharacterized protein n=1 Tax=Staurois parvus TaxID=386267 RepID=A0ABN9EZR0_9NEOB|nr:unnamed protein product [Staurois parvus]
MNGEIACKNPKLPGCSLYLTHHQGRTDNSRGPRAIGNHGAPVSFPHSNHTQKSL